MFQITLPVGAVVMIGQLSLRHLGDGSFVSDEPVWIIEGVTEDDTGPARDWPTNFAITETAADLSRPAHRRIAAGDLK